MPRAETPRRNPSFWQEQHPYSHRKKPANALPALGVLKKKVRDLDRLLARPNLTADARLENERALQATKHELTVASKGKFEQKIAKKYHMVRFFERKKAARKLKKLQKEHDEAETPSEELKEQVQNAEVELNYTLHYPRGEKYISLFKDVGDHQKVAEKRDGIKKDILKRMESGTLGARTMEDEEEEEEEPAGESGADMLAARLARKKEVPSVKGKKKSKKEEEKEQEKEKVEEAAKIENDDFFEF